jgi:class 3 adenylate cyclase
MREADSFISAALSKLPGFSSEFSPRRDWAGDPITVHKGLWSNIPGSAANDEVNRLATQQGGSIGAPASRASGGVDLRGITMAGDRDPESAGRDAYDRYQELAGHPMASVPGLRDAITKLIGDPRYQALPDGSADTPGTKLSILMDTVHAYRSAAMKRISADGNVRQAETEELRRVAIARGQMAAPNPTPTNTMDGMLKWPAAGFVDRQLS